jgi:hypothetical protein
MDLQIPILVKALAFERKLLGGSAEVVVLVATQSGYRESREAAAELEGFLHGRELMRVHGRPVRWVFAEVSDAGSLTREIARLRPTVLYLTPMRAVGIAELCAAAARGRVLTVSGVPAYAGQGAAVTIGIRGGRPSILVDLAAVRASGAEFGSQLLQVSELVGP